MVVLLASTVDEHHVDLCLVETFWLGPVACRTGLASRRDLEKLGNIILQPKHQYERCDHAEETSRTPHE